MPVRKSSVSHIFLSFLAHRKRTTPRSIQQRPYGARGLLVLRASSHLVSMTTAMTATTLRYAATGRSAGTKLGFGKCTLARTLCVLSPILVDSSSSLFQPNRVSSARSFASACNTNNEALALLKSFMARLEEPPSVRKPVSLHKDSEVVQTSTLQGLTASLVHEYTQLPPITSSSNNRAVVLQHLASKCGCNTTKVEASINHYQLHPESSSLASLRQACTPRYDDLFQLMLLEEHGLQFLVALRQDLGKITEKDEDLKELDMYLKNVLQAWFSPSLLKIRRITYEETSALVMETIATKEAVHPMQSLLDLKTRLADDHRVYAAFHPLLPEQPLVVCHVALRQHVSTTMKDVLETQYPNTNANVAVFYSISSIQSGLTGIDLGQFLLKQAMERLRSEFDGLTTFVTLSPIPRFRKWLQEKLQLNQDGGIFVDNTLLTDDDVKLLTTCFQCSSNEVLETFANQLDNPSRIMEQNAANLKPLLMRLAARYLVEEKHHGKPLDGVARFHIRNGAEMFQLNYAADPSRKGWQTSLGIMINYRYNSSTLAMNRLRYELDYTIPVYYGVSKWR